MKVYRYECTEQDVLDAPGPVIFLAGPTVRGNQTHLTSWRFEAIKIFKKLKFKGSLIVPEFTLRTESDKGKEGWIVHWENNGLTRADCIMFWIPRTRELIGLTTNFELGYWMGKQPQKVVYGRPEDAYRVRYLDVMRIISGLGRISFLHDNLPGLIKESIKIANDNHKVQREYQKRERSR